MDGIRSLRAIPPTNSPISERGAASSDYFKRGTIEKYSRDFHGDEAEFYDHVLGLKGLERSAVVLCVNGFKDLSRAAELFYVGLSRAR